MGVPQRFTGMPGMQSGGFRMNLSNPGLGQRMATANIPTPATSTAAKTTAVFVGNISEKADNEFVKLILQECGEVSNWRRIKGPNDKYPAFGFCDFADQDGTLRAIRVLNDFQLGEKKLNVKVDAKTMEVLLTYARQKAGTKTDSTPAKTDELPATDEELKKDEEMAKCRIKKKKTKRRKTTGIKRRTKEEVLEKTTTLGGARTLRERIAVITQDKDDTDKEKRMGSIGLRERKQDDRKRRRSESRGHSRSPARNERERKTESSRAKRSHRHSSSRSTSGSSYSSRSRSSSTDHSRGSRGRRGRGGRSRTHSRSRRASSEDSETARERRLLKKQVKEKEMAYNARLKAWEERERKQAKRYEHDEAKEKQRRMAIHKEAKKMKAFLEDYDDEKHDQRYYNRRSTLFQRRREYEREKEADAKDRQRVSSESTSERDLRRKEQQEIEDLKKQILEEAKEKGNKEEKEIEEEARRRHKELEEKANSKRSGRDGSGSPNPHQKLGRPLVPGQVLDEEDEEDDEEGEGNSSSSETGERERESEEREEGAEKSGELLQAAKKWIGVSGDGDLSGASSSNTPAALQSNSPRLSFRTSSPAYMPTPVPAPSHSASSNSLRFPRATNVVASVFNGEEDDDPLAGKKKLKLFEITQEERIRTMTPGEMKKLQREVAESIPQAKEALFACPIAWNLLEKAGAFDRIQAWVGKKIKEYIGEDEPSLVSFISEQLRNKETPEKVKADLTMVLDDESEVFVAKLWRLVVYESECASRGIPTSSSMK